jgi:hypothetical protein
MYWLRQYDELCSPPKSSRSCHTYFSNHWRGLLCPAEASGPTILWWLFAKCSPQLASFEWITSTDPSHVHKWLSFFHLKVQSWKAREHSFNRTQKRREEHRNRWVVVFQATKDLRDRRCWKTNNQHMASRTSLNLYILQYAEEESQSGERIWNFVYDLFHLVSKPLPLLSFSQNKTDWPLSLQAVNIQTRVKQEAWTTLQWRARQAVSRSLLDKYLCWWTANLLYRKQTRSCDTSAAGSTWLARLPLNSPQSIWFLARLSRSDLCEFQDFSGFKQKQCFHLMLLLCHLVLAIVCGSCF